MTSEIDQLKSTNRILIVALIIAAFFLGSLTNKVSTFEKSGSSDSQTAVTQTTTAPQQPQTTTVTQDTIKGLFNDKNIYFGDINSKNLLVEVADPSCPYCHVAAGHNPELNKQIGDRFALVSDGGTYAAPVPEMKKLVDEGKAGFVWIYTNGHGNGEMGTKALYCAHEKGKFWEVHDKLMTNNGYNLLNNDVKNDKAKSQLLADFFSEVFDIKTMKDCLDSGKYDSKLTEDIASARSLGVNGTPGFFVNTTNFAGAYSWTDMESAIK